jgi:hypothetical protein
MRTGSLVGSRFVLAIELSSVNAPNYPRAGLRQGSTCHSASCKLMNCGTVRCGRVLEFAKLIATCELCSSANYASNRADP